MPKQTATILDAERLTTVAGPFAVGAIGGAAAKSEKFRHALFVIPLRK